MKNSFLRQLITTVALAAVIFIILQVTFQSSIVIGSSMEPSFQSGERIVVSKIVYKFHEPQRGDVVIFHPPLPGQVDYIKRIIGLPGDIIEVKNGKVYVNGQPLTEPYIASPPQYVFNRLEVPAGYYFVLGDNRNNSNDSHTGWLLPRQNIIGKAWLSIWPPGDWGIIPSYSIP